LVSGALKLAQEKRQCANSRSVNHSLKFEHWRLLYLLGLTLRLGLRAITWTATVVRCHSDQVRGQTDENVSFDDRFCRAGNRLSCKVEGGNN
ncbi:MAG: hypothetical protein AAF652_15880, partial [Cyanobacteria bacterium P01_C01_bin.72]